jgi:hypothetical protein
MSAMTIQLVGAGLGRTGTLSLKLALERLLGGTCHHMFEVFAHPEELPTWTAAMNGDEPDWGEFLSGYSAIVDFPGAALWRELAAAFPDAPVLLSTRSSAEVWWESANNTIFESTRRGIALIADPPPADQMPPDAPPIELVAAHTAMVEPMIARLTSNFSDREAATAAYEAHNQAVRDEIAPERLFEYQPGDGWGPLCDALGLDEPDEPVPHTNTTAEFRENLGID